MVSTVTQPIFERRSYRCHDEASAFVFGGTKPGAVENAPRVVDLLTPEDLMQSEVLDYTAETSDAPVRPAQVRIAR